MHQKVTESKSASWVGRVPHIKPGKYADGLPFHEIQYLCCKLVLKPNHFRSNSRMVLESALGERISMDSNSYWPLIFSRFLGSNFLMS